MRPSTRMRLPAVASWESPPSSTVHCSGAAIGYECQCGYCGWPTGGNSGRRASTRNSRRSSTCRTSLPPESRKPWRCAGPDIGSSRGAPYTQDPEAYALYASGRLAWTRQTEPSLLAIDRLLRASHCAGSPLRACLLRPWPIVTPSWASLACALHMKCFPRRALRLTRRCRSIRIWRRRILRWDTSRCNTSTIGTARPGSIRSRYGSIPHWP